jgi:hypothetical protein
MKITSIGLTALLLGTSLPASAQQKREITPRGGSDRVTIETKGNQTIAKFVSENYQSERVLQDLDGDGWCDIWCSLFEIEDGYRSKRVDSDGDGLTDYEEMILMTNPKVVNQEPKNITPKEIAEREEAARRAETAVDAITRARATERKAKLAPFFPRELRIGEETQTVTRPKVESVRERSRKSLAEHLRLARPRVDARRKLSETLRTPEREILQGGVTSKLTGGFGGRPVAVQSDNHFSADLIRVTPLWPTGLNPVTAPTVSPALPPLWETGGSGLDLTGAGTRLALFEVGAVFDATYTQHEDLGNSAVNPPGSRKLWQVDSSSLSNFHAAGVAGVLVGEGNRDLSGWLQIPVRNTAAQTVVNVDIGDAARGMSYEAQLSAWDIDDSDVELATAFASHNANLSNHSYGQTAGWQLRSAPNLHRWWGVNGADEDFKFGMYFPSQPRPGGLGLPQSEGVDEIVFANTFHLPVVSAGNDRLQGPQGQNPNQIPPIGITHEVFSGGAWVQSTTYRAPDGDEGGYDSVRSPGTAKNILTVGSIGVNYGFNGAGTQVFLAGSSGRGPTDDGRLKPEIVAKGVNAITSDNGSSPEPTTIEFNGDSEQAYQVISGTSFAAPSVTGALNLCAQRYTQLFPDREDLHASTWRALAAHTAQDIFGAAGPDFATGYGVFNAEAITDLLMEDFDSGANAFVKEAPLFMEGAGDPMDYIEFDVVATGGVDLVCTIAWTDPAGNPATLAVPDQPNDVLINDVGIRIIAPDSTTWSPWVLDADLDNETQAARETAATRGVNHTDNLEQVLIPAGDVTAGETYTIRIERDDILETAFQWVSVAVRGITPQPRPPLVVKTLEPGTATNTWLLTWDTVVGRDYQIEFSTDLDNWSSAGNAATASKELMAGEVTLPPGTGKAFFESVKPSRESF